MSVTDSARRLGVCRQTIYNYVARRILRSVRLTPSLRGIAVRSVERYEAELERLNQESYVGM